TYLYEVTGISEATFTKMEKYGTPLKRPAKRAALLAGLGWAPGSFDAILNGGNPIPIETAEAAMPSVDVVSRVESLEQQIEELTVRLAEVTRRVGLLSDGVQHGARVRRSPRTSEPASRQAGG